MKKNVFGSINRDTKTLYIVNHKAANTTIVEVLKNYGYTDRKKFKLDLNKLNYIFTFVRNPYERLLSRYSHLCRRITELDNGKKIKKVPQDKNLLKFFNGNPIKLNQFKFNDFVKFTETHYDTHWELQTVKFIKQVGSLDNIDFIGRFENFQEDFNTVCGKIGIPQQNLPHKNKSKHKHYTEYYDDETRSIVAEKYAKDIEYFGYKFGE